MKVYQDLFQRIISPESLFAAWEEFRKGKSARRDVQQFEWRLEEHVFSLHRELQARAYRHGPYHAFTLCDPKERRIHKATVRDRIVHHAVFAALNPLFEPTFYAHSYSCRKEKGTHRAMKKLHSWLRAVSCNHHQPCFVLQCDISKFFDSVAHAVLLDTVGKNIKDRDVMWLLEEIIGSFASDRLASTGSAGFPIGNLTSQLFANVYLNELDQFIKHKLSIRYYIRSHANCHRLSQDLRNQYWFWMRG